MLKRITTKIRQLVTKIFLWIDWLINAINAIYVFVLPYTIITLYFIWVLNIFFISNYWIFKLLYVENINSMIYFVVYPILTDVILGIILWDFIWELHKKHINNWRIVIIWMLVNFLLLLRIQDIYPDFHNILEYFKLIY